MFFYPGKGHCYCEGGPHPIYIWMFPKIVGFPPKSSIFIEFSIINHLFWGTTIFGNPKGCQLNPKGW